LSRCARSPGRAAASWPTREEIERIRADYDTYCATPDLTGAVQLASRLGIVLRRVEWLEMLLLRKGVTS